MDVLFYKMKVISYSQYINGRLQLHLRLDVSLMNMQGGGALMHVLNAEEMPLNSAVKAKL